MLEDYLNFFSLLLLIFLASLSGDLLCEEKISHDHSTQSHNGTMADNELHSLKQTLRNDPSIKRAFHQFHQGTMSLMEVLMLVDSVAIIKGFRLPLSHKQHAILMLGLIAASLGSKFLMEHLEEIQDILEKLKNRWKGEPEQLENNTEIELEQDL